MAGIKKRIYAPESHSGSDVPNVPYPPVVRKAHNVKGTIPYSMYTLPPQPVSNVHSERNPNVFNTPYATNPLKQSVPPVPKLEERIDLFRAPSKRNSALLHRSGNWYST